MLDICLDTRHAAVCEQPADTGEKLNRLQQVAPHQWEHDVELEVAGRSREGDALSLPMTWAQTINVASQMTGLTLPGMIEEPGCRSGIEISPSPALGPDPIQRRSLVIFRGSPRLFAVRPRLPRARPVRPAPRNDHVPRSAADLSFRQRSRSQTRQSQRGIDSGANRGPAEWQLSHSRKSCIHPLYAVTNLCGVAAKFLAEGNRVASIKWVRPALTTSANSAALRLKVSARWRNAGSRVCTRHCVAAM